MPQINKYNKSKKFKMTVTPSKIRKESFLHNDNTT